ncbi:MAG: succinylglutamate desuccinylase/aspartoacylase family protein [Litoreibacter sp.]
MIDLDSPGRTSGYASLHNSTNQSAWQNLRIPIHCLNGEPGPTTLVLGGMHGDEYEGPVAIDTLAHTLDVGSLVGRLILVPALNLPAVMAGTRLTPDDGLNLNRVFPGKALGSLTERMAYWVTETLVPVADNVIDLHSGGRSLNFAPSMLLHETKGTAFETGLKAAKAFGAPFTVLLREDHADMMIDAVVERQGKVMIASELGGAGTLTSNTAQLAKAGLPRTLSSLGHFKSTDVGTETKLVQLPSSDEHILSDETIIFAPEVELGTWVASGEIIGWQHRIDRPQQPPEVVCATYDGWVLCVAGQGLVHRNDVLAIVARPAELG